VSSGEGSYAALTREDPNVLKRWLQARRIDAALRLVPADARRVIDYGAGDAAVAARLVQSRSTVEVVCFDPTPALLDEARALTAGLDRVRLVASEAELETGWADALLCLEVFEHLPAVETGAALETIARVLRPGGTLIVGVPIEVGPAALAKGLFRRVRRRGSFDAQLDGIFAAASGRPPGDRPVAEIAPGRPYHPHHLGFDHRRLQRELAQRFRVVRRTGSPFAPLGPLNAELYITAVKA
jgi:SAM-dependent methyltransferase